MPYITSENVTQAIVKLVANRVLPYLEANLVLGSLVTRDFEDVVSATGDTVNVPIAPIMTANNIAESGSVQTQNPGLGNAQVVLNSHIESSFVIPDITRAITQPDLIQTYSESAVQAVSERIETDIARLAMRASSTVGTGGSTSNLDQTIELAETTLFNNRVPRTAPKYLVLSGAAYSAARQLPRFSEYEKRGPNDVINQAALGQISSFNTSRTQLIQVAGGTTYNMAFAPQAIAFASRMLPKPLPGTGAIAETVSRNGFGMRMVMSYNPNTLAQQFTIDILYGVAIVRDPLIVAVLT